MSCASYVEALPARLGHSAECCHYVEAPCSPGPHDHPAPGVLPDS
jgi:hypothetical protein